MIVWLARVTFGIFTRRVANLAIGLLTVAMAIAGCGSASKDNNQSPATPPASARDGGSHPANVDGGGEPDAAADPVFDGGEPNIGPTRIYDTSAESFEAETTVAVSAQGDVVVAWMADTSAGSRLGYAVSRDRGSTWGAPELVSPSTASRLVGDPALVATSSGAFMLVWIDYLENDTYEENLFAAKLAPSDRAFGNRATIADRGSYDKPWIVSAANGTADETLIVAYGFGTTDESGIAVARSADGRTWSRVVVARDTDDENYNFARPCTTPSGDRIYLAYLRMNASDRVDDVRLARSDDHGASWPATASVSVPIAGESLALDDAACAITGGDVWVSYGVSRDWSIDLSPRLSAVELARSSNQGRTFDRRLSLRNADPGIAYMHPQIVADGLGALHVLYYEGHAASLRDGHMRRAEIPAGGDALVEHVALDEGLVMERGREVPNWLGDYFGVAWSRGSLFTAYAQNADGSSHVAFARARTQATR
ncbi:MAG: exo-alpha-sialidase [Deltaproteobacteria bacterium]|nr:exo-alpha-sialidase [Deltaproteobacteria bacterium]